MHRQDKRKGIGMVLLGIFLMLSLVTPLHELIRHGDYAPLTHVCHHPDNHQVRQTEFHKDCKLCDMALASLLLDLTSFPPHHYQRLCGHLAIPSLVSLDKTLPTHFFQLRAPPAWS